MVERRSQPRILDSELVMVSWEEQSIKLNQLGNVHDISLDGIGILLNDALPVGTSVKITYGEGELAGVVRHHSQVAVGCFIGIEFTETSKNSTLHFQPELLIGSFNHEQYSCIDGGGCGGVTALQLSLSQNCGLS